MDKSSINNITNLYNNASKIETKKIEIHKGGGKQGYDENPDEIDDNFSPVKVDENKYT